MGQEGVNTERLGSDGAGDTVQRGFVPPSVLRFGRWELAARHLPARGASVEMFDYYSLSSGRFAIALADPRGNGIPVAQLRDSLRAHCDGRLAIPDAMKRVNDTVCEFGPQFVQMFYGEFDADRGVLRYSNAGGPYPVLRGSNGSVLTLIELGIPLGIFKDADFPDADISIQPQDSLLLCSDGVVNALDPVGFGAGRDRLELIWQRRGDVPPEEAAARVMADIQAFRDRALLGDLETLPTLKGAHEGGTPIEPLRMEAQWLRAHAAQRDDMTLVVLGTVGSP